MKTHHVAVVVDDGVPEQEVGHGRRDLGPAVVLDDEVRYPRDGSRVRGPLFRDTQVDVRDARRADLEALAEELALRVDWGETESASLLGRAWGKAAPSP